MANTYESELINDLFDLIWGNPANVGTPLDTEFKASLYREFGSIYLSSPELGDFTLTIERA